MFIENTRKVFWAAASASLCLVACVTSNNDGQGTSIDLQCTADQLSAFPNEVLFTAETDALALMREEEKLARDVYLHLAESWGMKIFRNISDSEQTHTDAVKLLLDKYEMVDPAEGRGRGDFENSQLQQLYVDLTSEGDASLINALGVGALIEDLDIYDLQIQMDDPEIDNQDVLVVWENLQKGSRNHLRSFAAQLEKYGIEYSPRYIDQQTYDAIISSPKETGGCLLALD